MSGQPVADETTVSMETSTVAETTYITRTTTPYPTTESTTISIGETNTLTGVLHSTESKDGLIAGLVIGALLFVGVAIVLGIWIYKKKRSKIRSSDSKAKQITMQKDARLDDMETEDGTYEDTDMRDNSGRSDIEMQPAHVLHSHGFAATNNRAVPPKPPRLFKYTNQEFDDANQAEKDDRVIRSEETSQAADDDENIYLYADDEPNIKIDRTIPSEYVQYNPDSDHENTDNPKSIEDDCTYMNDESFSKTDRDVKEYDNIKTNPGPNEKRSHTDVEHNNRQSDTSVGKKYIDMNASPEPTKKLLHVNTDLRLNILGYAESGGEDYSPDLETPDYENSGNNNIPNNADSDTGSEEDEYYIEMKMVNHRKDEHQEEASVAKTKAMPKRKEQSVDRSAMAEPIVVSNEIIESKIPLPPPRRSKKIKTKEIGTSKEIIPGSNNVSDMRMNGDNDESQYLNENKTKVEEEKDEDNSELKTENDDYDYVYPDYKGEDNDSAEAHSMH